MALARFSRLTRIFKRKREFERKFKIFSNFQEIFERIFKMQANF